VRKFPTITLAMCVFLLVVLAIGCGGNAAIAVTTPSTVQSIDYSGQIIDLQKQITALKGQVDTLQKAMAQYATSSQLITLDAKVKEDLQKINILWEQYANPNEFENVDLPLLEAGQPSTQATWIDWYSLAPQKIAAGGLYHQAVEAAKVSLRFAELAKVDTSDPYNAESLKQLKTLAGK
jgi:hypothetical protein